MLSKSRFTAGWQCHKLLWWKAHEPNATELQPDKVLQDLFDQGRLVGEVARGLFPDGVLIDLPYYEREQRVAKTNDALDTGAPAVFEATFVADDTYAAIDVLERLDDGFRLIEVKGSTKQKDEHIPDVAVQTYVAGRSGIDVKSAEVMHLNRDYRVGQGLPESAGVMPGFAGVMPELAGVDDPENLFTRTNVTAEVAAFLPQVGPEIERQREMLKGPLPDVPIGLHCFEPRDCPFLERCWPKDRDHVSRLNGYGPKRTAQALAKGIHKIGDLPKNTKFTFTQQRQLKAMRENRIVVEPTLAEELKAFDCRLGFLDFETIMRAIPVWPGMKPWQQAAAQFSYHEQQSDGSHTHTEHLAEGPRDARPPLAEAMVEATKNAERVVMYTSFEKTRIRELQKAVPDLAEELLELEHKLIDLHPVIKNCVYHPDFLGSFSLKDVLTPLVPDLTYDDLIIVDGRVASVEIARLLFVADKIPEHERDRVRRDLLNYCERDTWAMVRLLERLRGLTAA